MEPGGTPGDRRLRVLFALPFLSRIGGTEPLYAGSMTQHVIESLAFNAGICVHLTLLAGREPHHIVEAEFKSLARALRFAVEPDPRVTGVPSTKGAL